MPFGAGATKRSHTRLRPPSIDKYAVSSMDLMPEGRMVGRQDMRAARFWHVQDSGLVDQAEI